VLRSSAIRLGEGCGDQAAFLGARPEPGSPRAGRLDLPALGAHLATPGGHARSRVDLTSLNGQFHLLGHPLSANTLPPSRFHQVPGVAGDEDRSGGLFQNSLRRLGAAGVSAALVGSELVGRQARVCRAWYRVLALLACNSRRRLTWLRSHPRRPGFYGSQLVGTR